MQRTFWFLFFMAPAAFPAHAASISLAGTWRFQLDAGKAGHQQNWYAKALGPDQIFLPGSTDQAGYGTRTQGPEKGWLSRPYTYEGPAWYEREVVIPEPWRGERITLFLERPHWQTEVWVDGTAFGSRNSLSTPHLYDLTRALAPGRHRLTICVDNSYLIDIGRRAHSFTDYTQTNWNGIIGQIELRSGPPVWVDSAQVYADLEKRELRVRAKVGNATGAAVEGTLYAAAAGSSATARITGEQTVEMVLPLKEGTRLWDEYEPYVSDLRLLLNTRSHGRVFSDLYRTVFGLRQIATRGTQFTLNGRPIVLRGTLECAIFPLTGYPPTDYESWERLFRTARSYGLNHFRFHSWCPPEAAFLAADRNGMLLHVELPVWTDKVGQDQALDEYMRAEGQRILETYGNHPSFTMLCLGNELVGDYGFMDGLVGDFKRADPRRLYTFTSDHRRHAPGPTSDYYVGMATTAGRLRLFGSRFEKSMSGTDVDDAAAIQASAVPTVAHELGQWAVYPSFDEIQYYSGVLKPRNLEAFRAQLEGRGMADQAQAFQQASGRFAWQLYKEDIETVLRTPGIGGFQLLQLHDFPGQGEALVGLLDSFWHSKNILTPAELRRFAGETTPLLRFEKFVWASGETFTAKAQVAHYGKQPIENAAAAWTVLDDSAHEAAAGKLPPASLPVGQVTGLGEIRVPLQADRARHLRISLQLAGNLRNDWEIWVYPAEAEVPAPKDVLVTHALDAAARARLDQGGKVALLWPAGHLNDHMMRMRFLPVFWSLSWFPKQPGTMGILCDPRHPALQDFPTQAQSNWQWWELTEQAPAFVLDDTPPGYRPIVQVIDDFHRNHKLGAVFEARVGKGKLLVSSLDLETDLAQRPVARQLRRSLMTYAGSARFNPAEALPLEVVEKLLEQ